VVRFSDLNLGSEAGIAALYRRIRASAHQVCEGPFTRADRLMGGGMKKRECLRQALEHAVRDVNAPGLTRYHLAKSGKRESPVPVAQASSR
jgi:UrcA family protein